MPASVRERPGVTSASAKRVTSAPTLQENLRESDAEVWVLQRNTTNPLKPAGRSEVDVGVRFECSVASWRSPPTCL